MLLHASGYDPHLAKQLIQQGVDVNIKSIHGNTPLHLACSYQHSLVELLIEAGADVNAVNCFNFTPLMYAERYPSILKLLLKHGADVHIKAHTTQTILEHACHYKRPEEVIRILYDATTQPLAFRPYTRAGSFLPKIIALYAGMCWKRSDVGGLSSHILTKYLV
jgi:ankyrin repeat protein